MYVPRSNQFFPYLVNCLGSEGAQALAESLNQNTTLAQLELGSMLELSGFLYARMRQDQVDISHLGNNIGFEGAQALAESLKHNTTLIQLNLYSKSGFKWA